MSIKTRLRFSYFAMLIIPFILIVALSHIYTSYIEGSTKYSIGEKKSFDKLDYYTQVVVSTNKVMKIINNQSIKNPDKILDDDFIKEIENNRGIDYTGIVVRKDNSIIYESQELKDNLKILELPEFDLENFKDYDVKEDKKQVVLGQQDFYFNDGSRGSVFYILDKSQLAGIVKRNMSWLLAGILLILICTNGAITYLVYRSIIRPLKELENAANEIKRGNLDYKINISSRDEIEQVGNSFENMRIRLKESIELQQQYEENRKELISNISHDLKTPITSIKGYVEGIKDGIADTPEKMNKYINTVHMKAKYMNSLIDDLLLFSKLDINKLPFDYQLVDFAEFMRDCIEEISFDMVKNRIELTSDIPKYPIVIKADVQKLKRVVLNIIENSMKYKYIRDLRIQINIIDKRDKVMVEIKDNGKGIEKEVLPYIFERFYRGDASRETIGGGSGLGLAIVKKIIEEHKGEIWAESEINKGTSIFFELNK